jgi:hypothetical protein
LASFEIWKETGHLIQLQNPRRLVSRFRDFLALAERREVNLPAPVLDRYVGAYALSKSSVRILRTEGRLILEIPGQPYYRLFAASNSRFFMRTEPTEIEFVPAKTGRISHMIIFNSDGTTISSRRIDSPLPKFP